MFRSLRYRNYRLFFLGNSISLIGNWMQWAAMGWLVFRLTGSPLWLGIVGFCRISILFIAPFAGVLADHFERRNLIVLTQALSMLQPALLAILTLSGLVETWHIVALSTFAGLVSAFDIPVRQAFVIEMIEDRRDLSNAIALNSSIVNAARLIGPSLAGVLIAAVGEGICFAVNAASYLAVIGALLAMRIAPRLGAPRRRRVGRDLADGVRYAFGFAPIRATLLLLSLVSVAGMPYQQLMPAFASDVLGVGPRLFGFMMGCVGVGALAGAAWLASRRNAAGLEAVIPLAAALFGAGLVLLALVRVVWVALPLLVLAGFGMMVQMASSNTMLQTISDDDKRGRVTSFYAMAFMGTVPLGHLLGGSIADRIGVDRLLLFGGICCLLGAAAYAMRLGSFRRQVRPLYAQLGMIVGPVVPVAAGAAMPRPPGQMTVARP